MSLVITWTPPAQNTDGTAIQPGEITGYEVGVRPFSGTPGTYPTTVPVTSASEAATAIEGLKLPMGEYAAAIRTLGPSDSAWSSETTFKVALIPLAPTDFRIQLTLPATL